MVVTQGKLTDEEAERLEALAQQKQLTASGRCSPSTQTVEMSNVRPETSPCRNRIASRKLLFPDALAPTSSVKGATSTSSSTKLLKSLRRIRFNMATIRTRSAFLRSWLLEFCPVRGKGM